MQDAPKYITMFALPVFCVVIVPGAVCIGLQIKDRPGNCSIKYTTSEKLAKPQSYIPLATACYIKK